MQSQNPLFTVCGDGCSRFDSSVHAAAGEQGKREHHLRKTFLHVIDRGSLGSPRQIHAVPQVQTRTSGVSGEMDEILQIAHDMILNK